MLATYLQLAGLLRNRRLEAQARPDARFGTRTEPRGFAYVSRRFESLRLLFEPARGPGRFGAGAPSTQTPLER